MLNAQHLVDLLTGYYYVNLHSTAYPSGELRGQIGRARLYQAELTGSQEVSPVTTDASGDAVLALSADASTLYYRIMVQDTADITAAHIHNAPAGVNGGVEFGLYSGTGSFDANNPISGSIAVTSTHVMELLSGNYYINIHTSGNPSGELRGQIMSYSVTNPLTATLSGDNEVPPVSTDASGSARFVLDQEMSLLHVNITVSDIMSITAAHIHEAPAGVNGDVAFGLYDGTGPFDADNPIASCLMLEAEHLVDLLTGYHYVNIHSETYPSGELRGQIGGEAATEGADFMLYLPVMMKN
jgi:hypothetical protein